MPESWNRGSEWFLEFVRHLQNLQRQTKDAYNGCFNPFSQQIYTEHIMSGTLLDTGETPVNKIHRTLCPLELMLWWDGQKINKMYKEYKWCADKV